MKKRILSFGLAMSMAFTLLPPFSLPVSAGAAGAKTMVIGTSGIATGDKVYYGEYDYNINPTEGAVPNSWRVLSTDGNATGTSDSLSDGTNTVLNTNAMFLISENALAGSVFF